MTEYRKIEDIREVLFRYAHNEHSKAFLKFLMSEIERKNKPDVVERSKIDKAIAEIEDYTVEDNCEDGVMFALETLKRCLKEKRR